MGLHLSNNSHVSSTSKKLLKEMPNSTLSHSIVFFSRIANFGFARSCPLFLNSTSHKWSKTRNTNLNENRKRYLKYFERY